MLSHTNNTSHPVERREKVPLDGAVPLATGAPASGTASENSSIPNVI